MSQILTKEQMYALRIRGKLGNSIPAWYYRRGTFPAVLANKYAILWAGKPGGPCLYDVPLYMVDTEAQRLIKQGWDAQYIIISAMGPESQGVQRLLQGEVMRSAHYLTLRYTTVQKPMRIALKEEENHAEGLKAVMLLKSNMEPNDYDDLMLLFDEYPDAIVEFTIYETHIGNCLRRNTIIWEVRDY